ncbi:hypothetical protein Vretifemale_17322, partial [Volvox reticuliferus]
MYSDSVCRKATPREENAAAAAAGVIGRRRCSEAAGAGSGCDDYLDSHNTPVISNRNYPEITLLLPLPLPAAAEHGRATPHGNKGSQPASSTRTSNQSLPPYAHPWELITPGRQPSYCSPPGRREPAKGPIQHQQRHSQQADDAGKIDVDPRPRQQRPPQQQFLGGHQTHDPVYTPGQQPIRGDASPTAGAGPAGDDGPSSCFSSSSSRSSSPSRARHHYHSRTEAAAPRNACGGTAAGATSYRRGRHHRLGPNTATWPLLHNATIGVLLLAACAAAYGPPFYLSPSDPMSMCPTLQTDAYLNSTCTLKYSDSTTPCSIFVRCPDCLGGSTLPTWTVYVLPDRSKTKANATQILCPTFNLNDDNIAELILVFKLGDMCPPDNSAVECRYVPSPPPPPTPSP